MDDRVRSSAGLKASLPRSVKDLARVSTRAYGLATSRWRSLPDFLIVGTKRGGTTSLWNYLIDHPQVLPMFPAVRGSKSNAYFFENLGRGIHWYRSHFHAAAYRRIRERRVGRTVTGEASPFYMYGPHIPRLIAEQLPAAKLIVLLRDPVARAHSHHGERVKKGVESLTFEEALEAEESRLAGEWARMEADPNYYSAAHDFYSYRDRGVYLPQLERIHSSFERNRVLILRSEDLYTRSDAVFLEVCAFLGIRPTCIAQPERHGAVRRPPIAEPTEAMLRDFFRPHNASLYRYLGRDMDW